MFKHVLQTADIVFCPEILFVSRNKTIIPKTFLKNY